MQQAQSCFRPFTDPCFLTRPEYTEIALWLVLGLTVILIMAAVALLWLWQNLPPRKARYRMVFRSFPELEKNETLREIKVRNIVRAYAGMVADAANQLENYQTLSLPSQSVDAHNHLDHGKQLVHNLQVLTKTLETVHKTAAENSNTSFIQSGNSRPPETDTTG